MHRYILIVMAMVWALICAAASVADVAKTPPLPERSKLHVYLLMGQSNMAGRGQMTDADREAVDRVLMMDAAGGWAAARHPLHTDKPTAGVGVGVAFARAMLEAEKDASVVIALVPCAVGGTPLSRWEKGGNLYAAAVERAKRAAEAGVIKGVLWHQGEADSGSAQLAWTYTRRLDAMIADLRGDVGDAAMPFVTGQLAEAYIAKTPHAYAVAAALAGVEHRVARTGFASSAGLNDKGDGTHFDAAALNELGGRYAAAMLTAQQRPADAITPIAARIERLDESNWPRLAPIGKEVDAIYGDYVMTNGLITAVIANPVEGRNANLAIHDVGGCLIDLRRNDRGGEGLHVLYPANNQPEQPGRRFGFRSAKIESAAGPRVALVCDAETGDKDLALSVRYVLDAERPDVLTIETTWTNRSETDKRVRPIDELRGSGLGRLAAGSSGVAAFEDPWWGYALGVLSTDEAHPIVVAGDPNRYVLRYRAAPDDDDTSAMSVPAGGQLSLTRHVVADADGVSVQAAANRLRNVPVRTARIDVRGPKDERIDDATIRIMRGDETYGSVSSWGLKGGAATVALPRGAFTAVVLRFDRVQTRVDVSAEGEPEVAVALDALGTVVARITDDQGRGIPCKVQLIGVGDTPTPFFFPRTGEHLVHNCLHLSNGRGETPIPPGKYRVIISRGPEFDAVFTEVTVAAGRSELIAAKLVRSVDTTGWVSADFHAHSSPSGDNDASQFGRVLTHLVEHIEYAPCTEHNRIDSYTPHLKRLGAEHLLATSTGIELTGSPGSYNHQNAFPLKHKPRTQDGGGPRTSPDSVEQISRLALCGTAGPRSSYSRTTPTSCRSRPTKTSTASSTAGSAACCRTWT